MRNAAAAALLSLAFAGLACAGSGERAADSRAKTQEPTAAATTVAETTNRPKKAASRPLTGDERRWVRRYAAWRDGLARPIVTIEDIRARWRYILLDSDYEDRPVSKYLRTLAAIERCTTSLHSKVDEPPGSRLDEAYELLVEGCDLMTASAASDRKAIAAEDIDAFDVTQADWDEGMLRHQKADEVVVGLLTYMRTLPVRRGATTVSRVEPVFSDAATKVSLENQEVRCWSRGDWALVLKDRSAYVNGRIEDDLLGFASAGEPAHLAPEVCERLVTLRYARARPTGESMLELADAVVVLAHEAEHVRGEVDEAVTECYAMQRARELARLLGAPNAYADRLAETFWDEIYPRNLPAYRTDDCRDGGPLDLRPRSRIWP